MGTQLIKLGDTQLQIQYRDRVLAVEEVVYGKESKQVANSLYDLALAYDTLGM